MLRRLLGWIIAVLARLVTWTLRVEVVGEERIQPLEQAGQPLIWVFWHGRQMLIHAFRRPRGYVVMVSHSRDGELQAAVMRHFGAHVVRGSSSRGGAAGLVGLARSLKSGHPGIVTADGPRGPIYCLKPGALHLARATGARLVPLSAEARTRKVLGRAWDRFRIPMPFTRVSVVIGEPLEVPADAGEDELERLRVGFEGELRRATREADQRAGQESEAELGQAVAA